MRVQIFNDKPSLAKAAADQAAAAIRRAIDERGEARVVAATGLSQFEFLEALTQAAGIDWSKSNSSIWMSTLDCPSPIPPAFANFSWIAWLRKPEARTFIRSMAMLPTRRRWLSV